MDRDSRFSTPHHENSIRRLAYQETGYDPVSVQRLARMYRGRYICMILPVLSHWRIRIAIVPVHPWRSTKQVLRIAV